MQRFKVYNWCKTHPVVEVSVDQDRPGKLCHWEVHVVHERRHCGSCSTLHGWINIEWTKGEGQFYAENYHMLFDRWPDARERQAEPAPQHQPELFADDRRTSERVPARGRPQQLSRAGSQQRVSQRPRPSSPQPVEARGSGPVSGSDMRMPWGKHKGKMLCDIPYDYFTWLLDQVWFSGGNRNRALREAIQTHIEFDRQGEAAEAELYLTED